MVEIKYKRNGVFIEASLVDGAGDKYVGYGWTKRGARKDLLKNWDEAYA